MGLNPDPDTIEEIIAFVVTEPNGDEGIPAFGPVNGMMMPLVGADEDRIKSLQPKAEEIAEAAGLPLKLVKFRKESEEWIHPTPFASSQDRKGE